jgi:hypothetical protein
MREDGFIFDKLVLVTNAAYTPTAFGPPETSSSPITQPVLSYSLTNGGLQLSWTGSGTLQSADDVTGPYTPVPGAGLSPVTISFDRPRRFFRLAK